MTRELSEFEKRFCMNCGERNKEITNIVFCIHPGECPKVTEVRAKLNRSDNYVRDNTGTKRSNCNSH